MTAAPGAGNRAQAERFGVLRPAPEPRITAIPDDEAVSLAKTAYHAARRAQLALMAQPLNQILFDPQPVTYQRLRALRTEARQQVQKAQQVEQLIGDAIGALEATLPPSRCAADAPAPTSEQTPPRSKR